MEWYLKAMTQYANFSGRARRKEYWMFALFYILILFGLTLVGSLLGETIGLVLVGLVAIVHFLPSLAIAVRRLHDTGKSGWYLLIGFIPFIGSIILIVFYCTDSEPQANQWGPNPKTGNSDGEFVEGVIDSF